MAEKESIESQTILNCLSQLKITLKDKGVILFLHQSEFISKSLYDESVSQETSDQLVERIRDEITLSSKKYHLLVDQLRKNLKRYGSIVDILDKEYSRLSGNAPAISEVDVKVPDQFSKDFSPKVFADWMKVHYRLPTSDCNQIIEKDVSGQVFLRLDRVSIKKFGFTESGYYILLAALDEINGRTNQTDAGGMQGLVAKPPLWCGQQRPPPDDIDAVDEPTPPVKMDSFSRKKSTSFEAQVRGQHKPQLKLNKGDKITTIEPERYKVADLHKGYYSMKAKTHGVALIINNMVFSNSERHKDRVGTDRDEYNLVETWRYLGYHVEVRRDVTENDFGNNFLDIDEFLEKVCSKSRTKVEHDSFVCCILSHGNKLSIYSSDSKEIPLEYLQHGLGESKKLNSKPKLFFIQACQGDGFGTRPIESKLQEDGELQTSRRADVFISYATVPWHMSYRHIEKGSWFIRVVCGTLCKAATSCSLNEMQHSINSGVSDNPDFVFKAHFGVPYKQQPTCSDQLRRNVHFFLS